MESKSETAATARTFASKWAKSSAGGSQECYKNIYFSNLMKLKLKFDQK